MKQLQDQGIKISAYKVGKPGTSHMEGDNTFIVVPTTIEMVIPTGKVISKSYLLGISADKGKTWKLVDGSGLANEAARKKMLPKLPGKLELPAPQQPTIIRD